MPTEAIKPLQWNKNQTEKEIREFKKLLRQRRRQRRLKNEFIFYLRSH